MTICRGKDIFTKMVNGSQLKRIALVVATAVLVLSFLPAVGCGGQEEPSTTPGTIQVNATLDGSPWSGQLQYTLTSSVWPAYQENIVPGSAWSANPGFWKCNYVALGPDGAILDNITPSPTQTLPSGGAITFTLNFTTPPPTPITIRIEPPLDDAEVREYYPDANLGSEPEMWVAPWGPHPDSRKHRAFVTFSLASLPAGAQVQSATLYLYHSGYYGGGIHTNAAYRVTDDWEEMIITWRNQPPSAPSPTDDISFDITETGVWRSWDVTPDIDAIATENGWVSWVIKHVLEDEHEQATVVYTSKEGGIAPYLEITYIP